MALNDDSEVTPTCFQVPCSAAWRGAPQDGKPAVCKRRAALVSVPATFRRCLNEVTIAEMSLSAVEVRAINTDPSQRPGRSQNFRESGSSRSINAESHLARLRRRLGLQHKSPPQESGQNRLLQPQSFVKRATGLPPVFFESVSLNGLHQSVFWAY